MAKKQTQQVETVHEEQTPIVPVNPKLDEYRQRNEEYEQFIRLLNEVFVKDADYMEQDYRNGRKVLLKGGAERALYIAGGRVSQIKIEHIWETDENQRKHYTAIVETTLVDKDDNFLSLGVGICSTRERKYEKQPYDSINTVVKMAKKRAFVDAVISGLNLSSLFTQDMEEDDEASQQSPPKKVRPMSAEEGRILMIYNQHRAKNNLPGVQHFDEIPSAIVQKIREKIAASAEVHAGGE